jgi:glycosyltransferase involved in cell wall biosynthesis
MTSRDDIDAASTGAARPVLVHDYLLVMRGAERTFVRIADIWPTAPIATLLYDGEVFGARLAGHTVRTSRLQRLGARQATFKALLPALPAAAERLPVAGHELVISSSSAFAHGVRPDPGAVHVCYCHAPFRYVWNEQETGVAQVPPAARPVVRHVLARIQRWDRQAAQDGTHYIANSRLTQERIRRFWGLEADIVHPPVELDRFAPATPGDHLLFVGELVRHKQVDVALEAAREARTPIKVVGSGADEARLRAEYAGGAEFLGRVADEELSVLYASCRALIVPNIEEFGITAVEAQASGRPVVAADGGGTRETVIEGETGFFFPTGDVAALARILRSGDLEDLRPPDSVRSAQRFSVHAFQDGIRRQVALALAA